MNKKMRILCAGLAAVTAASAVLSAGGTVLADNTAVVTAATAPASSSDEHSDGMTAAVKMVRSRIDIPAECKEFQSSINEYNGKKTYDLYWSSKDGRTSVNVSVCNGMIVSCYIYNYNRNSHAGISPYTDAQLEAMAKRMVNRILPEAAGRYRLENIDSYLSSDTVTVSFVRECRDVPVAVNDIAVVFNKYTGELESFYGTWYGDAVFTDPSKALSQQDIKKIYADDIKALPYYQIVSDKNGKKTAVPVYHTEDAPIYDAYTGEKSALKDDLKKYMNTDTYYNMSAAESAMGYGGKGGGEGAGYDLSEEEQEEADSLKGKLTSDQFRKMVEADPYMKITARYHTESFSVSRSYEDKNRFEIHASYTINTDNEYKYCSVTADAVTGKIYSFYRYDQDSDYGTPDMNKANALADEAVKYYLGDNASKFKPAKDNFEPKDEEGSRYLTYRRYENNIVVNDDNLYVTVNGSNEITSFSYTYTENVDFGDGRIITADRAVERLLEQKDLKLAYNGFEDLKGNSHLYLTYSMDEWYINAVTGELCGYDGKPESEEKKCPYTDIENSPYKDEIIALYTYGVDITGGDKLEPQKNITQDEFNEMLEKVNNWNPIVYTAKGTDKSDTSTVNSLDAARGFVSAAGLDDAAKLKGIYSIPVKGISSTDKDYGTVAVAYALGTVGEEFDAGHILTREEALHLLYSYSENAGKR